MFFNNYRLPLVYLCFAVLTLACTENQSFVEPLPDEPVDEPTVLTDGATGYAGVNEALWPFFTAYEEAAARRGKPVDLRLTGIEAAIEELPEEGVAGQCSYGYVQGRRIVIDLEFWENSNDNWREMVLFHELGHCHLDRAHREDAFDSGICKSIMRSGVADCRDAYNVQNRAYYLDELFEDGHPTL